MTSSEHKSVEQRIAKMKNTETGAVTYEQCPSGGGPFRCQCGVCLICGNRKHTAIHGPLLGMSAGSKPYGHEFIAAQ